MCHTLHLQNILDLCYEKYDEIMKSKTEEEKPLKSNRKKKNPMTDKMHKVGNG